jgi:hypothetical protein
VSVEQYEALQEAAEWQHAIAAALASVRAEGRDRMLSARSAVLGAPPSVRRSARALISKRDHDPLVCEAVARQDPMCQVPVVAGSSPASCIAARLSTKKKGPRGTGVLSSSEVLCFRGFSSLPCSAPPGRPCSRWMTADTRAGEDTAGQVYFVPAWSLRKVNIGKNKLAGYGLEVSHAP